MDIHGAMAQLAKVRPVFHSEADFQHALAWHLQQEHPALSVRLEYRSPHLPGHGYVDIWLTDTTESVGIELKYKTRPVQVTVNGEEFDLLNQGAQDHGRYDTIKDIQRLEGIVAAVPHSAGFVPLLTNDASYWQTSKQPNSVDAAFRLHDGGTLVGEVGWGAAASAGTRKGRETALLLSGKYGLNWRDYKQVSVERNGLFRYVLVEVARHAAPLGARKQT